MLSFRQPEGRTGRLRESCAALLIITDSRLAICVQDRQSEQMATANRSDGRTGSSMGM